MNAANTSDTFVPDFAHDSQMSLITPSIDDDMVELPLRCCYNEESSSGSCFSNFFILGFSLASYM
jgi:hypothetical protein